MTNDKPSPSGKVTDERRAAELAHAWAPSGPLEGALYEDLLKAFRAIRAECQHMGQEKTKAPPCSRCGGRGSVAEQVQADTKVTFPCPKCRPVGPSSDVSCTCTTVAAERTCPKHGPLLARRDEDDAISLAATRQALKVMCESLDNESGTYSAGKLAERLGWKVGDLHDAGLQRIANALFEAASMADGGAVPVEVPPANPKAEESAWDRVKMQLGLDYMHTGEDAEEAIGEVRLALAGIRAQLGCLDSDQTLPSDVECIRQLVTKAIDAGGLRMADALPTVSRAILDERAALHVQLANISGALCDASNIPIYEDDYARSVRLLTEERDWYRDTLGNIAEAHADLCEQTPYWASNALVGKDINGRALPVLEHLHTPQGKDGG